MERPIGRTIAEARPARGLTQEALAGLAGVATRTVSGVESGHVGMGMSVETLVRLADALSLNPGDELNGAVGMPGGVTAAGRHEEWEGLIGTLEHVRPILVRYLESRGRTWEALVAAKRGKRMEITGWADDPAADAEDVA